MALLEVQVSFTVNNFVDDYTWSPGLHQNLQGQKSIISRPVVIWGQHPPTQINLQISASVSIIF